MRELADQFEKGIRSEIRKIEAQRDRAAQRSDMMVFTTGRILGLFDAWQILRAIEQGGANGP